MEIIVKVVKTKETVHTGWVQNTVIKWIKENNYSYVKHTFNGHNQRLIYWVEERDHEMDSPCPLAKG